MEIDVSRDMCSREGKQISLEICVPGKGKDTSLAISDMCFPGRETYL